MSIEPFPIDLVQSGPHAGIATITLQPNQGPMVVLDHPLIQRIEATLRALPASTRGLVLASGSPRVFIAGADLKAIQAPSTSADAPGGLNDDQLDRYLAYGQRVFGMFADLPFTTAAAINGAALGGGLEIAMHCDALIASPTCNDKPYPVGLPETGLSICPGWGGTNLLPARMNPADGIVRTATGQTMMVADAIKAGLFDRVADAPSALLDTARSWVAERLGTIPGGRRDGAPSRWNGRADRRSVVAGALAQIHGSLPPTEPAQAVVAAVRAGLDTGWQAALDVERRELVRLRSTPAGRAAIQAFFDKSRK
ncbi:MAG: enoyl-CoA hydratase/isomerase family protein [Phycisphaeraceae bacterium]|nr:enoyl-CoA hydratase/isomerase family protein [Phycisphaeraceae bacterium]